MGISDTAAIVTCSACNLLEFLCFVVIIFEMSRHHSTHVRLCLSSQVDFSVHRFKESLSSQKNISSGRYELTTKILGHFRCLATVGGSVDDSQLFFCKRENKDMQKYATSTCSQSLLQCSAKQHQLVLSCVVHAASGKFAQKKANSFVGLCTVANKL